MDTILLLTRNGEREVTITIPLRLRNKISFDLFCLLSAKNDCILTFYKVKLQDNFVLNFRADKKDKIDKIIVDFEGLL